MILSRNSYTSIDFFLRCTFRELVLWIRTSNEITAEIEEKRKTKKPK